MNSSQSNTAQSLNSQSNQVQRLCFLPNANTQVCLTVSPLQNTADQTQQPLSTQLSIGGNANAGGNIIDNQVNRSVQGIGNA